MDGGEGDTNGEGTEGRADLFPVHLSPSGLRSPVMLGPSFRSLRPHTSLSVLPPPFSSLTRRSRRRDEWGPK